MKAMNDVDDDGTNERGELMTARLDERHRGRVSSSTSVPVPAQQLAQFWRALDDRTAALRALLAELSVDQQRVALVDGIDAAGHCLQQVRQLIGDAAAQLPRFELRRAQQRAQQLHQLIQDRQLQLLPRKKFGFKSRSGAHSAQVVEPAAPWAAENIVDDDATDGSTPRPTTTTTATTYTEFGVCDRHDELVQLDGGSVRGREVALARLTSCRVIVSGGAATMHAVGLRDCVLLLGPTATSVVLDDCHRCVLAVACQQLRARDCLECQLQLHVTSSTVIENCRQMRVGPAPSELLHDAHFTSDWLSTGLGGTANNWREVHDFDWLSPTQHSPNWSLLDEQSAYSSWLLLLQLASPAICSQN